MSNMIQARRVSKVCGSPSQDTARDKHVRQPTGGPDEPVDGPCVRCPTPPMSAPRTSVRGLSPQREATEHVALQPGYDGGPLHVSGCEGKKTSRVLRAGFLLFAVRPALCWPRTLSCPPSVVAAKQTSNHVTCITHPHRRPKGIFAPKSCVQYSYSTLLLE